MVRFILYTRVICQIKYLLNTVSLYKTCYTDCDYYFHGERMLRLFIVKTRNMITLIIITLIIITYAFSDHWIDYINYLLSKGLFHYEWFLAFFYKSENQSFKVQQ